MQYVKGGRVAVDPYTRVLDDALVSDDRAVLVPAARFLADAAGFAARDAPTGVIWPNRRPIAELGPYLDRLAAVALEFPSFRDGRAYTQARQLREQHGFRGEVRATGQVLRDQFVLMVRAGFDAFEVRKDADAEAFATAIGTYSVFYQPSGNDPTPALERRLAFRRAVPADVTRAGRPDASYCEENTGGDARNGRLGR